MKNPLSKLLTVAGILTAVSFLKPKKGGPAILIGDSQTYLIAKMTTKLTLVPELCHVGWSVANLSAAVEDYPVNKTVAKVFVCIGTNGNFNSSDKIEYLMQLTKMAFPNAKIFVIQGSYGWGNNVKSNLYNYNAYYLRFHNKGAYVLHNAIGYSPAHPTVNTPTIKTIATEINKIV